MESFTKEQYKIFDKYISGKNLDKLNFLNINTENDYRKFLDLWEQSGKASFNSKWNNLFYR